MIISELFEDAFSLEQLKELSASVIDKNTAQGIDNINFDSFNKKSDEYLSVINRKILKGNYRFSFYKEKLILKSRNSNPRLIAIPTIRDRIVLKSIHNVLKMIYPEIQLKLPQVYIQELKENIDNFDYYIKIDLSNFYGTISHGILLNILKERIDCFKLIDLINQSLTTATVSNGQKTNKNLKETIGIPQGIPISNFLASIYMLDMDTMYKKKKNIIYLRYVDDIIILCDKKKSNEIYAEILYALEGRLNLKINKDKTEQGMLHNNLKFDFLGYQFSKNNKTIVSVKTPSKLKFERSIIDIFHAFEKKQDMRTEEFIFRLNNKITGSISSQLHQNQNQEIKKYGWLFYYSQINDFKLLYHLDRLVMNLFSKYPRCNHEIPKENIKSFVKSYYEIKYNIKNSTYIHNPDSLNSVQRRRLLEETFGIKKFKNEEHVNALYYKYVYAPIKREHQDIQKFIS